AALALRFRRVDGVKIQVRDGLPSRGWKTFFRNHAQAVAAIDLCVIERLFAFLVLSHDRRQLLWFEVTLHPAAEWLARQITEAFHWHQLPPTWCGTTTALTDRPSGRGCEPWASATDRSRLNRRGKVRMWSV